jgi:RND family efflux transporter MFP subunit
MIRTLPATLGHAALALMLAFGVCSGTAAQTPRDSLRDAAEFDCVIEPKLMAKVGSPDTGIITSVTIDRDSSVEKGQVVAQLDSDLQRSALELARLKASSDVEVQSQAARLEYRKSDAARAQLLHSKEIASTKTRDEALTEQQLAELALKKSRLDYDMAQVELSQAQVRLDRRSIRSPVRGVVADVTIRPGEYAYEQAPLMTIAEIDPLYVKVFLPVRYYREVEVGTVAEVTPQEPVGGLYEAKVTVVDRVFDAASSTFGVRLELPNKDYALPAGLRCRIRFKTVQN